MTKTGTTRRSKSNVLLGATTAAALLGLAACGGGGGDEGGGAGGLVQALLTAAAVIAVTLVVARRVMPPVLEAVARACSPEVFLLSVIALCLGTAYLTALAGVSVSLGAFLAGLVVSESRHSAHALGEVLPLQILFSATFYPLSVYPAWIQTVIQALPLWHAVELVRGFTTGARSIAVLGHVLYFAVMTAVGLVFTTRRLRILFLD